MASPPPEKGGAPRFPLYLLAPKAGQEDAAAIALAVKDSIERSFCYILNKYISINSVF
ncbi:hypothetical protein [Aequorivita ciconiae]|uniref:hypothetical protein n=1 Tax=Aequorivita ciconiae TaxID=2494375 RepID=UPI0013E2AB56|nr:hypothetical protein [Aequorivita sp. H23M31]